MQLPEVMVACFNEEVRVVLLNIPVPSLLNFHSSIDDSVGFRGCFYGYSDSLTMFLLNYWEV